MRAAAGSAHARGTGSEVPQANSAGEAATRTAACTAAAPRFPLIIHADDFGETQAITDGIVAAIEAGRLTSASIMVNMPASDYGLRRARELSAAASFGVHLNLCEGRALTRASTLTDSEGRLHSKRALFLRAVAGRLRSADLEREISAQIARVRDAGVRISHVDGHKHLHQLPGVCEALTRVLPRFGIARVRLMRLARIGCLARPSSAVRELLARRAAHAFGRAGLRHPVRSVGLEALMYGVADPRCLADAAGTVELCCHPGSADADLDKPGSHARSRELGFLLSARFQELLERAGAHPVSYWQI